MTVHASTAPAVAPEQVRAGPGSPGGLARGAAFYLGMPLLLSMPLGWYGVGIASQMRLPVAVLLWSVIVCLSWWISDLCTRLLAFATHSRRPRHAWLLVGGFCINIMLARYHSPAVISLFLHLGLIEPTPIVVRFFSIERDLLDPHYLSGLMQMTVPGLVFWVAGNLAFEHYRRTSGLVSTSTPRMEAGAVPATTVGAAPATTAAPPDRATLPAFAPATAPGHATQAATMPDSAPLAITPATATPPNSAPPQPPHFFQRLSRLAGLRAEELVAVEAEDHYIQVHSTRGKELVYYRFRDALQELDALPGLQIHRSAWISRQHVTALAGRGRKLEVVLVTGDRLGVSLSNRGALLQAGLQPQADDDACHKAGSAMRGRTRARVAAGTAPVAAAR